MMGHLLDGVSVTKRFQALLKAAKLPKMRFHDLRHSSASLLFAQGIAARVVMERLGHSNIAPTFGTYSHVIPQLHHEAADAIDRVLGGATLAPV
jgi:integrase